MPQVLRTKSRDSKLVEEKRKIIINAALKVFSQKSYAGATVEEIAEAAGMTVGNVYRYIGSKKDILHLICLESKGSIKDTRAMRADLHCENVSETLKKAIRVYVEGTEKLAERIFFTTGKSGTSPTKTVPCCCNRRLSTSSFSRS